MSDENKHNDVAEEKKPLKDEDNEVQDGTVVGEELDSSKVKFINGGARADSVVDIDGQTKVPEQEFVGLTKEELLKYADDPYWVKVRWAFLIAFWVAWLGMLVAAIIIIVLAPKCPFRPNLDWWQTSVVYEVSPKSFQDTDGNGIGDLKGIENQLDYLRHKLNVTAVYLNPIYPSPMLDFGYDITDYTDVDPSFGNLAEFENMRVAMHKRGMKLIMDFVPNHVSDQHDWFDKSKASDEKFADYFIWHDGKPASGGGQNDPPNNWLSVYGGPAWTWVEERKQYYYHTFLPEQPDLNLRNQQVKEELKAVLEFWLVKGVDGFRVASAAYLYESLNVTTDEPLSGDTSVGTDDYRSQLHSLTTFQPETYRIATEWRTLLDEYQEADGKPRFMMTEAYGTPNQTMTFYEFEGKSGAHLASNMNLMNLKAGCRSSCVKTLIQDWMTNMPAERWANWIVGNHDKSRVANRMGEGWVNAINMLVHTLPGTSMVYYGEEIGMHDVDVTFDQTQDTAAIKHGDPAYKEYTRDPQRTPMQWSGDLNAGFSAGNSTWLPVAPDYTSRNVKAQLAHGAGTTNIEVFADFTRIRQEPSFQWGLLEYAVVDENILSYVRQAEGFKGYLVAINFGENPSTVDFNAANPQFVPSLGVIAAHTANFESASRNADYGIGTVADLTAVYLKPMEGVVFWWEWGAPDATDE